MSLRMLLFATLLAVSIGGANARDGAVLVPEAYQTGLTVVGEGLSLKLPPKWVMDLRIAGTLFAARSTYEESYGGRLFIELDKVTPEQKLAAIVNGLKQGGEVVRSAPAPAGTAGERKIHLLVQKKTSIETGDLYEFHLVCMRVDVDKKNQLSRLVVLRAVFPIAQGVDVDDFLANKAKAYQSELAPLIDSLYASFDEKLVGDGLIYNAVPAGLQLKISFQLPPEFQYAVPFKNDLQKWVSSKTPGTSYVLRYIDGVDFKALPKTWRNRMRESVLKAGLEQSGGEVPGSIDVKVDVLSESDWQYGYTTAIRTPEGTSVSSVVCEYYVGTDKGIFCLVYQAPLASENVFERNTLANQTFEAVFPVLKGLTASTISSE